MRMTVFKVPTHLSLSRRQKFTQIFAEAFAAELTCELQRRKEKAGNRLGRKGVGKWRKGGLGKLTVPFTCQSQKHTHTPSCFIQQSSTQFPCNESPALSFEVKVATLIRWNEIPEHEVCVWTQVLVPVLDRAQRVGENGLLVSSLSCRGQWRAP